MRALCLVIVVWFVAAAARASCATTGVEVLWTYPAPDARDVPLNAVFWVLATGAPQTATLNDVPLAMGTRGELLPGRLLPEHVYRLRLTYARPEGWEPSPPVVITFRTGKRSVRGPLAFPAPRATSSRKLSVKLERLLAVLDCYDTMQNTLVSFHAPRQAVGYLVDGQPWPSEYGAPARFVRAREASRLCVELVPIGKGGRLGPATRACVRANAPRP